ncbi:AP2/ERF family transcription factor [Lysinibacillus fusiformis]|uniref:AP2/ERF family transcription factor n=1 Tax=Lysinibacillus fusiformis TaxID=28031 RepID=UPI002EC94964|nr:AP2/ERF family transcription factor [Lysinibacillus fusiformis]
MVKEIPLQNGMVALVDDEDYERVIFHTWTVSVHNQTKFYVHTKLKESKVSTSLARYILRLFEQKNDIFIFFKDNNPLNCQKENMIKSTQSSCTIKRRGARNSSSKYKGVSRSKRNPKWVSNIGFNGKTIYLGSFGTEIEAAKAYNIAAIKYYGEIAFLNEINENNNAKGIFIEGKKQKRSRNKTGFRGVVIRENGRFRAVIKKEKKRIYVGTFPHPEQAAKAYDQKAYEFYGEKAILNFPENIDEYKNSLSGATETSN